MLKDTNNNEETELEKVKKPWYKQWYIIMLLVVFIVVSVFNYNFALTLVNGSSMEPNFHDGNIVLADRQYGNLHRFDVVVINSSNAGKILIKRVIGLPGDTIEYQDNQLFVNGQYVEDMYGSGKTDNFKFTVSENSYYCLGDNREHSSDSRSVGEFTKKEIIARVRGYRYAKLGSNPLND